MTAGIRIGEMLFFVLSFLFLFCFCFVLCICLLLETGFLCVTTVADLELTL